MTRRKRGEGSQPAEPVVEIKGSLLSDDDMTPEEADRVIAAYDRLALAEHRAGSAPQNEQYRQELLSIKRELGID